MTELEAPQCDGIGRYFPYASPSTNTHILSRQLRAQLPLQTTPSLCLIIKASNMHQFSRPPPVTASPANSPRTNPTRTNNPREEERDPGARLAQTRREGSSGAIENTTRDRDTMTRLDQVIQVRYPLHGTKITRLDADKRYSCRTTSPRLL